MERIIGAAIEKTVGAVFTGPEILLFNRFQDQWLFVVHNNFQAASTDLSAEALVTPSQAHILKFSQEQLNFKQPRDDYREFLELSIIFIGGVPVQGTHFQVPGAMHRARWMA